MAYNLARNSRVFVTTNLNTATGAVNTSGFTPQNTWEIQVLDGFTFSQGTANTTIQISEAGTTPIRGSRAFNTALNPVEISFSTYIRPKNNVATVGAEEKVLWNALLGYVGIEGTTNGAGTTVTAATLGGTPAGNIVRSAAGSATFTIGGAAMNTFTAGSVYTFRGLTGTAAPNFNKSFKVVSSSATELVGEYLTPPPNSAVTVANVAVSAGVKMVQSAWVDQATGTGVPVPYGYVSSANSDRNQLQPIGFIFKVDTACYTIDNCAIDQASIDFGLDAIATVAWTARGTLLNNIDSEVTILGTTMSGGLAGTFTDKTTDAIYLTNKLSTVQIKSSLGGVGSSTTAYNVALTGGNIQIANNINYITPNNIGVLNLPIGYFTGARVISGTINAYLRTGAGQASDLLNAMLDNLASSTETKYWMQIEIGGSASGNRVEIEMPGTVIGVPSVDIADVVSTSITFNAQGTERDLNGAADANYDLENTNDITLRYYAA